MIEVIEKAYQRIAEAVVHEILDKGLGNSTWKDSYPEAYIALALYRKDLTGSVLKVLKSRSGED